MFSHFKIAQKTTAVKSEELAYTSPSTAENQNVSENIYARDPTTADPKIKAISLNPGSVLLLISILRTRCVMVQKRKRIVNALARPDREFTNRATISLLFPASKVNIRPTSRKKGAPGGCPTSSLYDAAINSPQSQKLAVGSSVDKYVNAATTKMIHPIRILRVEYFFIGFNSFVNK
jgi:hypothetical protein